MAYKKKAEVEQELALALQRIADLEAELETIKNGVHKHNERNAGRPRKYGEDVVAQILMLHSQGKSIRNIAQEVSCSIGFVHKTINEH